MEFHNHDHLPKALTIHILYFSRSTFSIKYRRDQHSTVLYQPFVSVPYTADSVPHALQGLTDHLPVASSESVPMLSANRRVPVGRLGMHRRFSFHPCLTSNLQQHALRVQRPGSPGSSTVHMLVSLGACDALFPCSIRKSTPSLALIHPGTSRTLSPMDRQPLLCHKGLLKHKHSDG